MQPPMDRITDACENITFPHTPYVVGNNDETITMTIDEAETQSKERRTIICSVCLEFGHNTWTGSGVLGCFFPHNRTVSMVTWPVVPKINFWLSEVFVNDLV